MHTKSKIILILFATLVLCPVNYVGAAHATYHSEKRNEDEGSGVFVSQQCAAVIISVGGVFGGFANTVLAPYISSSTITQTDSNNYSALAYIAKTGVGKRLWMPLGLHSLCRYVDEIDPESTKGKLVGFLVAFRSSTSFFSGLVGMVAPLMG